MNRTILIVEDNASAGALLERALISSGFHVHTVTDGLTGWQTFLELRPPLVLSDIRMPGMDGVELLRKIKEIAPSTDVVLLTGHGDLQSAKQAVELGATSYLEKPIDHIADLIQLLENALEKRQFAQDRALIERISFDLSQCLHLPTFMERFAQHLRHAFPQIDAIFISLQEPQTNALIVSYASGVKEVEAMVGVVPQENWSVGAQAFDQLSPVWLDGRDYRWDEDPGKQIITQLPKTLQAAAFAHPNLGVLGVPFVSQRKAIGSLSVVNLQSCDFLDKHLAELLTVLCRQVGLYLDNAQLFNDLQAQTGRLQTVLDSIMDGVIVIDPAGQVVMTNPSYHAMLSQGATFDEDAQARLIRMIQTELQDSEQTTLVLRVVHPTSDTLTMLEVNATHVKRNERSVGIVANLRDVTHLYNLDEKRSDLLQLASHEIGTPLDAISAYAKILNDTNTPVAADQRSNILTLIEQQAQEVKRLVVQTLDYSQVKAKMLTQAQERVNLSQLVHELAQEYEPLTHQKGILFHNNIEPDLWVIGQAQALKQAFRNLLENARKFTPAGGNIHWVAFRQNNTVQIEVRDDGIGIPADELGNVFRLYYRASSASDIPGSGLGLSIVQEIIQIHRGRIAVESTEGEGTSFTVTLAATAA